MSKTILVVIRNMAAEAWEHPAYGYVVAVGTRRDGWKMHLSPADAKELRNVLDEVIQAAEQHMHDREVQRRDEGASNG